MKLLKFAAIFFLICLAFNANAGAYESVNHWLTTDTVSDDWKKESSTRIDDKQTVLQLKEALKESRAVWEKLKKEHDNTYSYSRGFSSWVGFGHSTRIVVQNGVVVGRHFKEFNRDREITSTFTEGPKNINTNPYGAPPKTLDEIYDECEKSYLTKNPKEYIISLVLSGEGILTSCTYRRPGCVDDCSMGLDYLSFTWDVEKKEE